MTDSTDSYHAYPNDINATNNVTTLETIEHTAKKYVSLAKSYWKITLPISILLLFVIPLPINGIRSSSTNSSILASLFFKKSVKVGAYYYPWYYGDSNFHGGKYIRTNVSPSQLPTLGAYDDANYNTISQHIQWSHQANINVWVISWWGEGSSTDTTFLNYMLPHDDFDLEFAIHYETTGLTRSPSNRMQLPILDSTTGLGKKSTKRDRN